jgi:RHS repeat-associated protein
MTEARAPRNGYVYVYLSNASVEPVYFDNFTVSHQRSALIGEDHYYAFGLRIQAISSKAVASSLNANAVSYGYQGSFSEELNDLDLNYNEFDLRTYDPQIGRWTGVDPYDEFASPFTGMGNDPVNNVDPNGGSIGNIFNTIFQFIFGGSLSGAGGAFANSAGLAGATTLSSVAMSTASSFAIWGSLELSGAGKSVNVAIYFVGKNENGEDKLVGNSDGKDQGQWHVIVAYYDVSDGNKKLSTYLKKRVGTVDNLILSSHGYKGGINAGPSGGSIGYEQLKQYDDTYCMSDEEYKRWVQYSPERKDYLRERMLNSAVKSFLDILGQVSKNGNVVITGCGAGGGESGDKYGKIITAGRSFTLYLNQDASQFMGSFKSGFVQICTKDGRLTENKLVKGWKKFKYKVGQGDSEITKGQYDVNIGYSGSEIPIQYKFVGPKKAK